MSVDAVKLRREHVLDILQRSPGGLYWEDIMRALGITGQEAKASGEALIARGKVELIDGRYTALTTPDEIIESSAADLRGAAEGREELRASHPSLKKDLVVIEPGSGEILSADIVRPVVSPKQAAELWAEYQELTKAILDKSDYQDISGNQFKKKSAWRKYARFFNISDEIQEKNITRDNDGRVVEAEFIVKALAANGRSAIGWGSCSIFEKAHQLDKVIRGNISCKAPCDGRAHFTSPDNTIPATAHTRAKNRAISDIIGAGEVSAEEES